MQNRKWTIIAVSASLGLGALAIGAPPRPGPPGPRGPGRGDHGMFGQFLHNPEVVQKLGLSDEEVESLRKLGYEASKKQIELNAQLQEARLEVHHLLGADEPDENQVMNAIEEAGEAAVAVRKAQVKHMLEVRRILGPEKWNQVRTMMHEGGHRGPPERHERPHWGREGDHRDRDDRMDRRPPDRNDE